MEDENNPLKRKDIIEILDKHYTQNTSFVSSFAAKSNAQEEKKRKRMEMISEKKEFIASLAGCYVSIEIMGEWNVIRNDIREYLSNINTNPLGGCSSLRPFIEREQTHLASIKEKVGQSSIEYQMISSLVAQAVVLDCESNLIESEPLKISAGISTSPVNIRNSYNEDVIYQRTLKDCLNALANVSKFDMEYQYKCETFTPTYDNFKKLGINAGLAEKKESPSQSNSGCMGILLVGLFVPPIAILAFLQIYRFIAS
ncbi:MAG: hypothetical protein SPL12_08395 [Bacteroidales bacterium]|nr:hypothetical protein [Bacteroidales bacterium]